METTITITVDLQSGTIEQNTNRIRQACNAVTGELLSIFYMYSTGAKDFDGPDLIGSHVHSGAYQFCMAYKAHHSQPLKKMQ